MTIPFYRSRTFGLILGLGVSVVCMWLAVRGLIADPQSVAQMKAAFQTADYSTLPLVFLTLAMFYWLKAWRWRLMLVPVGDYRPVKDLLPPIMIGFALNNVLPARMGELVRCLTFARQQKLPLPVALSSVVLERIVDGLAVVTYLGCGLLLVQGVDPSVRLTAYVAAGISLALVTAGLIYVFWTRPFVAMTEWILSRVPLFPASLKLKVCRLLEGGAQGLASLKDIRLLLGIMAISFIKWGLNGLLVLYALWSFDIEVPNPLAVCAVTLGVIAFGVAVPTAPGYFGVIQLCFMTVLQLFTNDQGTVFAASIYYHLSQYIPVTLIGLAYLAASGLKLNQVESASPVEPAPQQMKRTSNHAAPV